MSLKTPFFLNDEEREFKTSLTKALIEGNEKLEKAYYATGVDVLGEARMQKIQAIAKNLAEKAKKESVPDKTKYFLSVDRYHPAIELSHFCRNVKYKCKNLSIPLGAGIFWEIIVPHIVKITQLVGCKYLYLFAADNTENDGKRLLRHYQNTFKLRSIEGLVAVRPNYDDNCPILIQEIETLKEYMSIIWDEQNL